MTLGDVPVWIHVSSALGLGAIGLWCLFAPSGVLRRKAGAACGAASLIYLACVLPWVGGLTSQAAFWLLSAITVIGAAAAITCRSPVYTAILFALSLLGTAGLFLLQGAQFLGVATVVVYAGAIVVTFLFVLMLAQPEGNALYDRITWAPLAVPAVLIAGTGMLVLVVFSLSGMTGDDVVGSAEPPSIADSRHHMAHLGTELFARHLVAVEVTGTLLLVALVGAVAIVIQGRGRGLGGARPQPAGGAPSTGSLPARAEEGEA